MAALSWKIAPQRIDFTRRSFVSRPVKFWERTPWRFTVMYPSLAPGADDALYSNSNRTPKVKLEQGMLVEASPQILMAFCQPGNRLLSLRTLV